MSNENTEKRHHELAGVGLLLIGTRKIFNGGENFPTSCYVVIKYNFCEHRTDELF